jgi:hypothetical protein
MKPTKTNDQIFRTSFGSRVGEAINIPDTRHQGETNMSTVANGLKALNSWQRNVYQASRTDGRTLLPFRTTRPTSILYHPFLIETDAARERIGLPNDDITQQI